MGSSDSYFQKLFILITCHKCSGEKPLVIIFREMAGDLCEKLKYIHTHIRLINERNEDIFACLTKMVPFVRFTILETAI